MAYYIEKISTVILYTNRSCTFFDKYGNQMPELQDIFNCYGDKYDKEWKILNEMFDYRHGIDFYISDWGLWEHIISYEQFCFMLGHGLKLEEKQKIDYNL